MGQNSKGKWILLTALFLVLGTVYIKTGSHEPDEKTVIRFEEAATALTEKEVSPVPLITTAATEENRDTRISINTADKKALMSLPMIGDVRARAIIDYRTEHGPFSEPEDIMKVSGIGKGIYERIKEKIKV